MLSKCANPGCAATFLYLHQGKLFRLDTSIAVVASTSLAERKKPSRRIEFFWLCHPCATELTPGLQEGNRHHGRAAAKGLARAQTA